MKAIIAVMIGLVLFGWAGPLRTVIGKGQNSTTSGLTVGRCDIDSLTADTAKVSILTATYCYVTTLIPDSNSHWSIDYIRADTVHVQTHLKIDGNRYLTWGSDSSNMIRIDNNGTKQLRIGSTGSVYCTIDSLQTYVNSKQLITPEVLTEKLSIGDTATHLDKITIVDTFLLFIIGSDTFKATPY